MSKKEKENEHLPKEWIGCPVEEEFLGHDRKAHKIERKLASSKDRSKFKKTDKEKFQRAEELEKMQKLSKEGLERGRVLSIKPEGIIVASEQVEVRCILRGLLKKDKSQFKNLVTVGDFVLFEKTAPNEGVIAHIEARRSTLSRADNLSRRKEQLIAANIDQVIITASVIVPPLKPSLIDRYIIAAKKGNMEPVVVVNKIDLLTDESVDPLVRESEQELFDDFMEGYLKAGIIVIPLSNETGEGLDALREAMHNKASVFSGQSGVGKSSLINAVTDGKLRIGDMVHKTGKGSHTTTTTQLVPLKFGGWCIDTPGIKSFGVWDLKQDEVENYFTEIHEIGKSCHYPNCSHSHETGCAVINAVESGEISSLRHASYLTLIYALSQEHIRR